jgi:hypothetical protein
LEATKYELFEVGEIVERKSGPHSEVHATEAKDLRVPSRAKKKLKEELERER